MKSIGLYMNPIALHFNVEPAIKLTDVLRKARVKNMNVSCIRMSYLKYSLASFALPGQALTAQFSKHT